MAKKTAKTLFSSEENSTQDSSMVWVASNGEPKTKAQKDFLSALKKHQDIIKKAQQVDELIIEASKIYSEEIIPEHEKQDELEKEKFEVMFDIYINDVLNLKGKIKKDFRNMLLDTCHENSENPKYTKFYYKASLQLETLAEKKEREYEMKKAEREIKKQFGFDVDMEEMASADFNDPETAERLKEKYKDLFEKQQANFNEQHQEESDFESRFGNHRFERKKTAKQLEKEKKEKEVEALLNKDINKLFKELAKAIHPDREQDPALRDKKENLMKQLSNARDNMNIGEILYIKMLIDDLLPENGIETTFNDDSMQRFVKIIKAKILDLERLNYEKIYNHPMFEGMNYPTIKRTILPLKKEQLRPIVASEIRKNKNETMILQKIVDTLKNNPKTVKDIIREYQEELKYSFNGFDLDDLADIFSKR